MHGLTESVGSHPCHNNPTEPVASMQERAAKGRAGKSALKKDGTAAGSTRKPARRSVAKCFTDGNSRHRHVVMCCCIIALD